MKITVAIPTYKRPVHLRKAAHSVLRQTLLPDFLFLISREDDYPTIEAINKIITENITSVQVIHHFVSRPGFLPPLLKAINESTGDVTAILDDDAVAHDSWLASLVRHYADPVVGGAGGRIYNYQDGVLPKEEPCTEVGRLYWNGVSVGNMYKPYSGPSPVKVDFVMGGNMSYRTKLLRACAPDITLGNNVAFHWEMDVGLKVRDLGYDIIYDPDAGADHFSAEREVDGMRTLNKEAVYWYNHNYSKIMVRSLSTIGLCVYLFRTVLIGSRGSPGFLHSVAKLLFHRTAQPLKLMPIAWSGIIKGIYSTNK